MKKFILAAIMLLAFGVQNINAQSVVKNGNTFKSVSSSSSRASKDTLSTKFEWEDSKGKKYPIIVNKGSGACYVWRKSAKTGKMYKSYLGAEISQAVCKELNITYIPKNKKK